MADCKKYEDYGIPLLNQGGWEVIGDYVRYTGDYRYQERICTINYVPNFHPNTITITGIANKELEVAVLILKNNNYVIAEMGWYENGHTFDIGDDYDKLGVAFRYADESNIALNEVTFDEVGAWVHSLRKLTTATDTITTLPIDIYADGNTATVGISGNTVQSGTPSPDNPIMPQGTGERTGNLYDYSKIVPGYTYDSSGQMILNPNEAYRWSYAAVPLIEVEPGATYFRTYNLMPLGNIINFYDSNKNFLKQVASGSVTTVPSNCNFVSFVFQIEGLDVEKYMFTKGSTAPSTYIPYGYKIGILSANTTTPVYLGEVETTRRIRKLVLTGDEVIYSYRFQNTNGVEIQSVLDRAYMRTAGICTHYPVSTSDVAHSIWLGVNNKTLYMVSIFDDLGISTVAQFKSYLAAQYANGTPVTVWYVLATETTGIVNEPLMKIGDYADTVSGITVPTIIGKDTFDVDTTLKPSEASLSYTGWHDATVKEWDGSQWNE